MDQSLYTRISMAGWLFVTVVLAALWDSDSEYWDRILTELNAVGQHSDSTLVAAFVGAAVGVGGPPAIGFLIERTLSVVMSAGTYLRSLKSGHYSDPIRSKLVDAASPEQLEIINTLDGSAISAIFFNEEGNELLVNERSWRKTQFFLSLTSAIGIGLGLTISKLVFDAATLGVSVVFGFFLVVLAFHGILNGMRSRRLMQAWIRIRGIESAARYAESLSQVEAP